MFNRFSPDLTLESGLVHRGRGASHANAPRRILAMALLLGLPVAAQSPGIQAQPALDGGVSQTEPECAGSAGIDAKMEARRFAVLNQQRQMQMVTDAEKLLKLAQELNSTADAGGTILSPSERLQKAAEIEKLAKNVKDKMIYAIGPPGDVEGPFAAWMR